MYSSGSALLLMVQPQGGQQSPFAGLLPILLIMVVFYFFMIRPQMKKAKEAKQMREAIKKGDQIITVSGIHGKITEVAETTFVLELENGSKMRIEKTAVGSLVSEQTAKA